MSWGAGDGEATSDISLSIFLFRVVTVMMMLKVLPVQTTPSLQLTVYLLPRKIYRASQPMGRRIWYLNHTGWATQVFSAFHNVPGSNASVIMFFKTLRIQKFWILNVTKYSGSLLSHFTQNMTVIKVLNKVKALQVYILTVLLVFVGEQDWDQLC